MPAPTKVLVLGASGRLGRALLRIYRGAGISASALSHTDLDLSRPEDIAARLARYEFDVLINTAGITDVDYCEANEGLAMTVNGQAPGAAAAHCRERGARFVQISTDYVFDGSGHEPITEDAPCKPVNAYGRSKLEGEQTAVAALPDALVLRVSWLFGIEKSSFPDRIIRQARERLDVSAVNDKWACPTYADDVCHWMLKLLSMDDVQGTYHLCNAGACSWQEYGEAALTIASQLGVPLKTTSVRGHTMEGFAPFLAARPPYTALSTAKFTALTGIQPRNWDAALEDYLRTKHLSR